MNISEDVLRTMAEEKIAFVKRSGLKLLEARSGYVKCLMPMTGNENHMGTMYAGALYTLAEIPGGVIAFASFGVGKYVPLLKSSTIKFLKPAKGDITYGVSLGEQEVLRVIEEAKEKGKSDFVLEGELKDSSGIVVAVYTGVYQIRAM
ncbi:DUF4442 domain-containing protein [Sansalvadorimonas sp. 2012CJ34-2]|uniref:DUF4442 domain-containing protein n=1 Tax=Parendozoicomonas callyspongiae TaxID=2942213 RepID=A0ABT0PGG8_9GAMM|nr:YiiD C-terminal domain-containing protein [Sansalvadorimonas sp. 2012CJ34-2]MCL6270467.1 DUF4442 domain-containing protein [Sansalvadorimonas sp. 2012CJ34-2]